MAMVSELKEASHEEQNRLVHFVTRDSFLET